MNALSDTVPTVSIAFLTNFHSSRAKCDFYKVLVYLHLAKHFALRVTQQTHQLTTMVYYWLFEFLVASADAQESLHTAIVLESET